MYLVYVDESGNTGTNLHDLQQPIFVLNALIVPEDKWQGVEQALEKSIAERFPSIASTGEEIHATDLRTGRNHFAGVSVTDRLALRDDWLNVANQFGLKIVYRAIVKKRFQTWLHATFGAGVLINPHVAAFPLIARVVDDYLSSLEGHALGMFISDENKEIVRDVEKSIKVLRGTDGDLRLCRIVEKGFFIDSAKSRLLQLCDICALCVRKHEEAKAGLPSKSVDESAVPLIEPLIHRGNEALSDVLTWLAEEQLKLGQKK